MCILTYTSTMYSAGIQVNTFIYKDDNKRKPLLSILYCSTNLNVIRY